MPHKLKYDWKAIQAYYDQGHSVRECSSKFGFGTTARLKAMKAGRFVPRTHEEACELLRKNKKPVPTGNVCSSTTWKGEFACAKLDLRALEKGLVVSRPLLECSYDRVIDDHGKLQRVQIKHAKLKDGVIIAWVGKTCRTRSVKIPYDENEIDVIVVYSSGIDKLFWLPKEVWLGKMSISLRISEPKNGQKKSCIMASDYEW